MSRPMAFGAVLAVASIVAVAAPQSPIDPVAVRQLAPAVASCRHDARASDADRTRRQQALTLAKAINAAQGTMAQRTRAYQPLSALAGLPPVPSGFSLKLFAERDAYMFALKDTLDACRYAIFSDAAGLVYEQSGRSAPIIAQ